MLLDPVPISSRARLRTLNKGWKTDQPYKVVTRLRLIVAGRTHEDQAGIKVLITLPDEIMVVFCGLLLIRRVEVSS